jgi:hypothetical protein
MASELDERLRDAADRGDVACIAAALLAGADLEALDGAYVMTPLQWAAYTGHVAAIAALLKAGARVDGMFRDWTPLILAACRDCTAAMDALLTAGADVHHAGTDGGTALHRASYKGHMDAARLLVEAGARTDVRNEDGQRSIDEVRAPACSLPLRDRATPPRCRAQVCKHSDKSNEPALCALLAAATPWSRRRPVAIACYGDVWGWEWEA